MAAYVEQVHRAYLAQADTFPPAVRGRMALLAGGELAVAALAEEPDPDPEAVRKALLAHVGGRTAWTPGAPSDD